MRANLVHACGRCNREKSGRTPQQWRTARLAAGLSWPPADPTFTVFDLVQDMPEADLAVVFQATAARYPRLMRLITRLHDDVHRERDWDPSEQRDRILSLAREHAAAVLSDTPTGEADPPDLSKNL